MTLVSPSQRPFCRKWPSSPLVLVLDLLSMVSCSIGLGPDAGFGDDDEDGGIDDADDNGEGDGSIAGSIAMELKV